MIFLIFSNELNKYENKEKMKSHSFFITHNLKDEETKRREKVGRKDG